MIWTGVDDLALEQKPNDKLSSNLDTDAGEMPAQVGASTSKGRERISVWASFDGGRTWPVKRLVYDGPSAYSNLDLKRTG